MWGLSLLLVVLLYIPPEKPPSAHSIFHWSPWAGALTSCVPPRCLAIAHYTTVQACLYGLGHRFLHFGSHYDAAVLLFSLRI